MKKKHKYLYLLGFNVGGRQITSAATCDILQMVVNYNIPTAYILGSISEIYTSSKSITRRHTNINSCECKKISVVGIWDKGPDTQTYTPHPLLPPCIPLQTQGWVQT